MAYKADWMSRVPYGTQDIVTYNGDIFVATQQNVGIVPGVGPTWRRLDDNGLVPELLRQAPGNSLLGAPGTYNVTPYNLSKFRAALAASRDYIAGAVSANVAFVGDSTTRGIGATVGTDAFLNGWPQQLPEGAGYTSLSMSVGSIFGFGGVADVSAYDSRIALGGWTNSAVQSFGGNMFLATSAATLSFTPQYGATVFEIYYVQSGGNGTFDVSVNADPPIATVNSAGTGAVMKHTVTLPYDNYTLNCTWVSGGPVYIIGFNSFETFFRLFNGGASGLTSAQAAANSNVWGYRNVLSTIAPALTFVSLGINDWVANVDLNTYMSNMQSIISTALETGDVIIITPPPSATSQAPQERQQAFVDSMYALAAQNNCPLLDFYTRIRTQESGNSLGFYADTLHCSWKGYNDWATMVNAALRSIV